MNVIPNPEKRHRTRFVILLAMPCMILNAYGQKIIDEVGVEHQIDNVSSYESFEQPDDNGYRVAINSATDPDRKLSLSEIEEKGNGLLSLSTEHARNGKSSLRVEVPNTNHSFRTEISRGFVKMGSENWYGFSIYIPASWQYDSQANILAQWHAAVAPEAHQIGDGSAYPPIEIDVVGDEWRVKIHWNSDGAGSKGQGFGQKTFKIAKLTTGVWTDFVAHAIWSGDVKGKFELWMNGEKILDYIGGTEYSAQKYGPTLK